MKIIPYLALASFCSAFVACNTIDKNTSQEVSFSSETPASVLVSLNGKPVGKTPCNVVLKRSATYNVAYSKEGYQTYTTTLEPILDEDENGNSIYVHLEEQPSVRLEPEAAKEEPAKTKAKPEAPKAAEPVAEEDEEAVEEVVEEDDTTDAGTEAVEEEVETAEEEPAAEEEAVAEAEEEAVEEEATEEPAAEEPKAAEPAPEAKSEEAPKATAPALDPTRSFNDIKNDLEVLKKQKQTGQISEDEFNARCQKIGEEIKARYAE